jgi:hypothetical protein
MNVPGLIFMSRPPRAMVRSEGDMSLKNPVTPTGIDPGTIMLPQAPRIRNTYYFSTATVVAQICPNVTHTLPVLFVL